MNILIRKLIFNEADIHLILWNNKPCFFVSELSKALDSVNKEDISVFLRYGGSAAKGIDYDVVAGAEAKDLRKQLEDSCIKKKFAHTMIIYFDGLRKYFNYRKTIESKDFTNYLLKCKISLDSDSMNEVVSEESTSLAPEKATETAAAPLPPSVSSVNHESTTSKSTKASKKSEASKKPAVSNKPVASDKNEVPSIKNNNGNYSDFLKHISFMEEFVDTFNKINISSDKSVAFTKSMAKFFDNNGVQIGDFLREMKKWIV
jgi:hypothetical protein